MYETRMHFRLPLGEAVALATDEGLCKAKYRTMLCRLPAVPYPSPFGDTFPTGEGLNTMARGAAASTNILYRQIEKKAQMRLFSMVKENGGQGRRRGISRAGFRPCRCRRSGAHAAGTTSFHPAYSIPRAGREFARIASSVKKFPKSYRKNSTKARKFLR